MTERRATPGNRPLRVLDQVHVLDGERAGAIGVVQHATLDTLEVVTSSSSVSTDHLARAL